MNGSTVPWAQSQWNRFACASQQDYVFLNVGINDLNFTIRRIDDVISDYQDLVDSILSSGCVTEVYAFNVTPVGSSPLWRPSLQAELEELNATIAAIPGVTLIDVHSMLVDPATAGGPQPALDPIYDGGDGLHWNEAARILVAEFVCDLIDDQ